MTSIPYHHRGVLYYQVLGTGKDSYWSPTIGEDRVCGSREAMEIAIDAFLARQPNAPPDGAAEFYHGVWYRTNLYGLLRNHLQYYALRPGPEGVYDSVEDLCAAIDEFNARQTKSQSSTPATPPPPPASGPPTLPSPQGQVVVNIPPQPTTKILIQCRHCGSLFEVSSGKCNSCGAPLSPIGGS